MGEPQKYSLTKNQKLVYDVLLNHRAPLSAYAILDLLRDQGLRAPQQIYRALEKLTDTGQVHKLESLNTFVACAQPNCCHHQLLGFIICNQCGAVNEFSENEVEAKLSDLARGLGFKPQATTIEIKGLCADCANA
ncbi:Fur family transcriptional regulator [Polycladidibacter stylochi]|uniref:Fur family transcriptional regulator n=1 Tax=Polycladidibacter stylochi TaxID=1807766 RepID=UPI0008326AE1|nr:Fur family transcriptional regulator [Pseudovibrio stylochi]